MKKKTSPAVTNSKKKPVEKTGQKTTSAAKAETKKKAVAKKSASAQKVKAVSLTKRSGSKSKSPKKPATPVEAKVDLYDIVDAMDDPEILKLTLFEELFHGALSCTTVDDQDEFMFAMSETPSERVRLPGGPQTEDDWVNAFSMCPFIWILFDSVVLKKPEKRKLARAILEELVGYFHMWMSEDGTRCVRLSVEKKSGKKPTYFIEGSFSKK